MKVAVVGSRGLTPTAADLTTMLPPDVTEIVTGGADGVDAAAARYAQAHGLKLTEIRPEYRRWGTCAPLIRNAAIVEAADLVVALWDGMSTGTKNAMQTARKLGKPLRVYTKRT